MSVSASIIINNYNYGRFLAEAIDSALSQTQESVEVIVVDDGSTDHSKDVILSYGNKIIPLFKTNGGQASAFNAGFSKSSGQVIIFLDSDDILYPDALKIASSHFNDLTVAKVHWPLEIIDNNGIKSGRQTSNNLPEGNFREHALTSGPPFFLNSPTSGNAWSRRFLKTVLPMPEQEFRIGADTYLFETVAFYGSVRKVDEPLGGYRIHGKNNYHNKPFLEKLHYEVKFYDSLFEILLKYCKTLNLIPDIQIWIQKSWFHQLAMAIEEIKNIVSEGETMILLDDQVWDVGHQLQNRKVLPFLEKDGKYAGAAESGEQAIIQLEAMVKTDIHYLIIGWPCFWWLEEFTGFSNYLYNSFYCILNNERIIAFDLKQKR